MNIPESVSNAISHNSNCNGKSVVTGHRPPIIRKKTGPQMPQNSNWLLFSLYATGRYDTCRNIATKQLQNRGDNEFANYVSGLISREEEDYLTSAGYFQKAIETNPFNSNNFKELAKIMFQLHNYDQALQLFQRAETLMQKIDYEIYYYIGTILKRTAEKDQDAEKLNEAKEYLRRAMQSGRHRQSYLQFAEMCIDEGDFPRAIEMYETSLTLSYSPSSILTKIGLMYLKLGENQKSFEKLLDVTYSDNQNRDALLALGAILQNRNDWNGALNKYKQIDEESLAGGEVWNNIGLCFLRNKKYAAAITCLRKAVKLTSLNYDILLNLGLVLLQAQQYANAFCVLAAVLNKDAYKMAETLQLIGICLTKLNDPINANMAFEKACTLALEAKNVKVFLNAAIFYYQTQNIANCHKSLETYFAKVKGREGHTEEMKTAQALWNLLSTETSRVVLYRNDPTGNPNVV